MEPLGKLLDKLLENFEKKDYEKAEKIADELLAGNPNFHRGMFLKGVILEETGRKAEAEEYFKKCGNTQTLWFRAAMQVQDSDPDRAISYYNRFEDWGQLNNLVLFNKGDLYEKTGKRKEAGEYFREIKPFREVLSRIVVPVGFIIFLAIGAFMMIERGQKTLAIVVIASAVFCLFWLKRDAGPALKMLIKKANTREKCSGELSLKKSFSN